MDYPWYEVVRNSDTLEQGDIVRDCPIIIPPDELRPGVSIGIEAAVYDVIVLTQSCDLEHDHISNVLVAPVWNWTEMYDASPKEWNSKRRDSLRRGNEPRFHLLDKCSEAGAETDLMVIDFSNIYGVPIAYLRKHAKSQATRLRLLHPFREDMSQSLAKFFMRVGLPVEMPLPPAGAP